MISILIIVIIILVVSFVLAFIIAGNSDHNRITKITDDPSILFEDTNSISKDNRVDNVEIADEIEIEKENEEMTYVKKEEVEELFDDELI